MAAKIPAFAVATIAFCMTACHGETHGRTLQLYKSNTFSREARAHQHELSMAAIMNNITLESALEKLRSGAPLSPEISAIMQQLTSSVSHGHSKSRSTKKHHHQQQHLRSKKDDPDADADKGYGGVDKATKLLNEMLQEVGMKYETEISRCCEYHNEQTSLIETCRTDMSTYSAETALARQCILSAQEEIDICTAKIPELTEELRVHNKACAEEEANMEEQKKIIEADIEVMKNVLEMTDCQADNGTKTMMFLERCVDECSGESFVSFNNSALKTHVQNIQSSKVQKLVHKTLKQLYGHLEDLEPILP